MILLWRYFYYRNKQFGGPHSATLEWVAGYSSTIAGETAYNAFSASEIAYQGAVVVSDTYLSKIDHQSAYQSVLEAA